MQTARCIKTKNARAKLLFHALSPVILVHLYITLAGETMRIGIIFPVIIFISAVVFIWFFIGGYAAPGA